MTEGGGCITSGRRAGYCPPGGGGDEAKRLECLMVGSRIRATVDSIYDHVEKLQSRPDTKQREQSAAIIHNQVTQLDAALVAARKSCGWFDDSEIGHAIDVLSLEAGELAQAPATSLPERAERLRPELDTLIGEMHQTEDRAIAADPPLFRNLRRVVQSRPHEPAKTT